MTRDVTTRISGGSDSVNASCVRSVASCVSPVRTNGVGCLLAHVARVEDEQDRRHVAVEPVGHDRSGMLGEFRLVVGE